MGINVPDVPRVEGNTKSSTPSINPALRWCFTLNNWTQSEYEEIIKYVPENCKLCYIADEVGESGTPHLQGYLEFITKKRPKSIFKNNRIHWEKAKGTREDNDAYCGGDDKENSTRIFTFPNIKKLKIIHESFFYEWQKDIKKKIDEEPDDRTVIWVYETEGNVGKSAFTKWAVAKRNALFCNGGKSQDIINLCFNHDMETSDLIIWDMPRANKGVISYTAIESIKNGLICNTKYETGVKMFNPPHILIFSNYPPQDVEQLSKDRWEIYEIKNKCLEKKEL
ncbi:MAG: replication associated protein [Wigfec virus K19_623]|nr:MAG: replication associated protein [Wigfec virus K19_623]